ncbi:hypothetical protein P409_12195 [Inquilinus limosus MP06]|uniref:Uncharacterized protein n=1 Tax=Inquilinus limosus MP06 TaxID=1398085 RepID=A0A0A0D5X0_9PROT|nr:hypothetical protein P409_12195 [Inquilinus limosus MP06]
MTALSRRTGMKSIPPCIGVPSVPSLNTDRSSWIIEAGSERRSGNNPAETPRIASTSKAAIISAIAARSPLGPDTTTRFRFGSERTMLLFATGLTSGTTVAAWTKRSGITDTP